MTAPGTRAAARRFSITPRRVGMVVAIVTMGASAWYVFAYLSRWEWNRALVSGMFFLAAEIGIIGVAVISRLGSVERRIERLERLDRHAPDPQLLARVQEAAPPRREPFAWLSKSANRTNVFVPVLLGAGVVLSGLAWVVERVARLTAEPGLERGLARRLEQLAPPVGGLLGGE
jgi:hypothetical protein